jgi:hypothetical protein
MSKAQQVYLAMARRAAQAENELAAEREKWVDVSNALIAEQEQAGYERQARTDLAMEIKQLRVGLDREQSVCKKLRERVAGGGEVAQLTEALAAERRRADKAEHALMLVCPTCKCPTGFAERYVIQAERVLEEAAIENGRLTEERDQWQAAATGSNDAALNRSHLHRDEMAAMRTDLDDMTKERDFHKVESEIRQQYATEMEDACDAAIERAEQAEAAARDCGACGTPPLYRPNCRAVRDLEAAEAGVKQLAAAAQALVDWHEGPDCAEIDGVLQTQQLIRGYKPTFKHCGDELEALRELLKEKP